MSEERKDRISRLESSIRRIEIKLNDGMTDSLTRIDRRVENIEEVVNRMLRETDPAVRLHNCPYRALRERMGDRKEKLILALYAILIAAAAGAPAWIDLFFR